MRVLFISVLILLSGYAYANEPQIEDKPEKTPISEFDFAQKQRTLFNKADLNFDGRITKDESQMARFEDQKDSYKKRFKELDKNFSGFLEPSEIENWHIESTEKRIAGYKGQRENLLETYDLDKNGTISPYELDQVYEEKAEKAREQALSRAEKDFSGKDFDQSGSVSLDEYIQSKAPTSMKVIEEKLSASSVMQDANRDGIITRAEHETYIAKVFDQMDKNDDGELSASEQNENIMKGFDNFQPNSVFMISDRFPGARVEFKQR